MNSGAKRQTWLLVLCLFGTELHPLLPKTFIKQTDPILEDFLRRSEMIYYVNIIPTPCSVFGPVAQKKRKQ